MRLAVFHRMIRFARAIISGGIVRPICFAVLRLMTKSNFIGCSTGRSAGFSPIQDFVDEDRSALKNFGSISIVGGEAAGFDTWNTL